MGYRERDAGVALRPWVRCVWSVPSDGGTVLPDGCIDIVWNGSRLLVAGPDTMASPAGVPHPGARVVGVRFRPGAGGAALGLPASELRDARVDLAEVWGAPARELASRLAEDPDPALIEEALAARVTPVDPLVLSAARRVAAGASVREVALDVELSERQLRRRFHDAVGYGPKTLGRVMRLQRFLRLARAASAGEGLASLAAAAGYGDQAHLSADARSLTGRTPSALVGRP